MTDEQYAYLRDELMARQAGKCATCGEPLEYDEGYAIEIAHRIPRGRIVRLLGKEYEWHPDLVALVCTRRGKACNDAQLVGAAHPVEEATLLLKARGLA